MKKLFIIVCIVISTLAYGQSTIQPFALKNVVDEQMTSLSLCSGCKGVVVIFTSLKCPYDHHYRDRIKALYEKQADKISFYLVNSNPDVDEEESKMKTTYTSWNLRVPYLSDKKQTAMKALNVTRTPEAILLKPEGTGYKIIYQGAIDDNPQVHHDTDKDFLSDAIDEFLLGKPILFPTERVIGCTIRKAN